MSKPLTPDCPLCSHPPKFIVGITQAFCGNDRLLAAVLGSDAHLG